MGSFQGKDAIFRLTDAWIVSDDTRSRMHSIAATLRVAGAEGGASQDLVRGDQEVVSGVHELVRYGVDRAASLPPLPVAPNVQEGDRKAEETPR